ncbi:MAG: hypothetical protein AAF416_19625 [Pseudomonadota bacterium]
MLKGFRDGHFALGIVAGISLTLLIGTWLSAASNQIADQEYRKPGDTRAADQKGDMRDHRQISADRVDYAHPADEPSHPQYYSRQDLQAQQTMADATQALVGWTAASFVLGLAGVVLVGFTLYETRRGTRAVVDSNNILRDTAYSQIRAYVGITDAQAILKEIPLSEDFELTLYIEVANGGQTPAFDVSSFYFINGYDIEKKCYSSLSPGMRTNCFMLMPQKSMQIVGKKLNISGLEKLRYTIARQPLFQVQGVFEFSMVDGQSVNKKSIVPFGYEFIHSGEPTGRLHAEPCDPGAFAKMQPNNNEQSS